MHMIGTKYVYTNCVFFHGLLQLQQIIKIIDIQMSFHFSGNAQYICLITTIILI